MVVVVVVVVVVVAVVVDHPREAQHAALLLSQKLERFYKSVVEEALLGKDPDVAEDFTGKNKIANMPQHTKWTFPAIS